MKRHALLGAAIVVIAVAVWFAVFRHGAGTAEVTQAKPVPLVRVDTAKTGSISELLEITGSIEATRIARLAAPVEGPVIQLAKREGDHVRAGEVVARIGRNRAAAALLASAQEDLTRQEQEAARVEQLVQRGAMASEQLDWARAQLERVRAAHVRAREGMDDFVLSAPWTGIVSMVSIAEGNFVAPRAPLVEIYDPGSLVIRCAVPEASAAVIKTGLKSAVLLDAYPGRKLHAKVSRVYGELDRRTRTLAVEARLDERLPLMPGMFARLSFALRTVPDAVIIPSDAIVITPTGQRVVFLLKDGKVARKMVKTGIEARGRVQIIQGVAPGDVVVVAGNESLKDGAKVRVQGAGGAKKAGSSGS